MPGSLTAYRRDRDLRRRWAHPKERPLGPRPQPDDPKGGHAETQGSEHHVMLTVPEPRDSVILMQLWMVFPSWTPGLLTCSAPPVWSG